MHLRVLTEGKTSIVMDFVLRWVTQSKVPRSFVNLRWVQSQASVTSSSARTSRGLERTLVNQMNTRTVSKATLEILERQGGAYMGFSEQVYTVLNRTERIKWNRKHFTVYKAIFCIFKPQEIGKVSIFELWFLYWSVLNNHLLFSPYDSVARRQRSLETHEQLTL